MPREINLVINFHDLVIWGGPIALLLLVIVHRRRFRLWRGLWGISWYRREYVGETTWFPTYRKRYGDAWVTAAEATRPCYVSTGLSMYEPSRRAKLHDAEMKLREREGPAATRASKEVEGAHIYAVDTEAAAQGRA